MNSVAPLAPMAAADDILVLVGSICAVLALLTLAGALAALTRRCCWPPASAPKLQSASIPYAVVLPPASDPI